MPKQRIAPSEHLRQALREFFQHGIEQEESPTSALLGLATRVVLQEALEAEQRDVVGRERYERGSDGRYRNGYRPGQVEGAEGRIKVEVPQVRGVPEHRSALMEFLGGHSEVLERLVTEMYARGLSTRDIEDAFTDATGRCLLSRSAVSEVTEVLGEEYEAFCERDLGQFPVIYLFADAVYESLRCQGGPQEALLCAWGICEDGRRIPLHLALGNKESYPGWLDFLRTMVGRGLEPPLTMTSDGAPGLLRALEEVFPQSVRIRCWMHKMQNVLGKLPESAREEVKAWLCAVRDAPTPEAGHQLAAETIAHFERDYPAAMKCFADDLEASLAHLRVPLVHRKFVRTTNLIERAFEEERRRTKVIPRFFDERSCLKLAFAALDRAARHWQHVTITELEYRQLALLRRELGLDPNPADRAHHYQKIVA
jgi:transposase-like protein